ncbi:MAG: RhuM family protein [Bacteroidota bacterium]
MKDEIIIYQPDAKSARLEVRIEKDMVWLNRHQLSVLFDRDIKTIGKHIVNALREELKGFQVVAKFATTAADGKIYQVEFYNLDMIISIGYRVKSQRGIQFRIWANKILKEYLLKGYAVNNRIDRLEYDVHNIKNKLGEIDFQLKTTLPPNEGIFFDGKVFDANVFVTGLIKSAKKSIILIDNYVDEGVLLLLSKRKTGVTATIYTKNQNKTLMLDLIKHNEQYPEIIIKPFTKAHDRFLIIDHKEVYHIGASLKDLGKKWFAFSKIKIDASSLIKRLV